MAALIVRDREVPNRNSWLREVISYLVVATGTLMVSVAFNVFLSPNHVLVSGIGGVAILIAYLLHASLGIIYFIINIPLFLGGWKFVGFPFFLKSIWGTVTLSLFLVLTKHLPAYHHILFAAGLGGMLSGIAIGVVLLAGGTTGGTDIISVVLNRTSRWSVGRIMFAINAGIVLCGAILFGIDRALLTVGSLFVTAGCVNLVLKVGGWEKKSKSNPSGESFEFPARR